VDIEEWALLGAGLGRFRPRWRGKWKLPSVHVAAAVPRCLVVLGILVAVHMYCCLCVMLGQSLACVSTDWHTPV
jgi:hypothetical protein